MDQRNAASSHDRYDLSRFVQAQVQDFDCALSEIKSGRKRSHWMWYIFPQLVGLGQSPMSHRYGISGLDEARAYLNHPVLGARLLECVRATLDVQGRSAREIFGSPDDLKLKSCATLFSCVSLRGSEFDLLLEKYFGGQRDEMTLKLLGETGQSRTE
jgi:uncharacterized protein (DUF1810 family)